MYKYYKHYHCSNFCYIKKDFCDYYIYGINKIQKTSFYNYIFGSDNNKITFYRRDIHRTTNIFVNSDHKNYIYHFDQRLDDKQDDIVEITENEHKEVLQDITLDFLNFMNFAFYYGRKIYEAEGGYLLKVKRGSYYEEYFIILKTNELIVHTIISGEYRTWSCDFIKAPKRGKEIQVIELNTLIFEKYLKYATIE